MPPGQLVLYIQVNWKRSIRDYFLQFGFFSKLNQCDFVILHLDTTTVDMYVFGMREQTGIPGENPPMGMGENIQTPHRIFLGLFLSSNFSICSVPTFKLCSLMGWLVSVRV